MSRNSRAANPTAMTSGPTVKRPRKVLLKSSTFWIQPRQRRPVADRVVEALRIVVGIGQRRVVVMAKMQRLEAAIGKEQPERQEDQRLVQRRGCASDGRAAPRAAATSAA